MLVQMATRIYVVEDDDDAGYLLSDVLAAHGFAATFVGQANQCLQRLTSEPSDVVITDFQMPDMNGIELCERIRETFPGVLTIVVTGMGADVKARAVKAGAFECALKPVRITALIESIRRGLERQQASS